jgi:hypothetical protein
MLDKPYRIDIATPQSNTPNRMKSFERRHNSETTVTLEVVAFLLLLFIAIAYP